WATITWAVFDHTLTQRTDSLGLVHVALLPECEVERPSILRTGLPVAPLLFYRLATGLSAPAPAQRAGAQRLRALAQASRCAFARFLADTGPSNYLVRTSLHSTTPATVAYRPSAAQSRQQGKVPAVRRCCDTMSGPVNAGAAVGAVGRGGRPCPPKSSRRTCILKCRGTRAVSLVRSVHFGRKRSGPFVSDSRLRTANAIWRCSTSRSTASCGAAISSAFGSTTSPQAGT